MKTSRILVIPGLGDIHWVALKLRAFCRTRHIEDPEVWIWDFDNRPRSLEYVQRLSGCRAGGYWHEPLGNKWHTVFNECYMFGSRDVVSPFGEFDHFICFNGSLRQGRALKSILPECEIEWDYPVGKTPEELVYGGEQLSRGKYLLLYFSDQGMFRNWLASWPAESIGQFIDSTHTLLPDYRLLLTGSPWDKRFAEILKPHIVAPVEDLVAQTNFDQLMGLIRGASGFAGWCGGNTMIATHLGTPTYMLWSDYFCKAMQTSWVAPPKIGGTYSHDYVSDVTPQLAAERFAEQVRGLA